MEAFSEAIKIFAEKHLVPSIISLVSGAGIYLFTPDDWWVVAKTTKLGYWLLVSGCVFILIQLLIKIWTSLSEHKYYKSLKKSNAQYDRERAEEYAYKIWDYVDSLQPDDRKYLYDFLKNGNQPLMIRGQIFNSYGRLLNSEHIRVQKGYDAQGSYCKYVLDEPFYRALKATKEYFGKISRFEEE